MLTVDLVDIFFTGSRRISVKTAGTFPSFNKFPSFLIRNYEHF